MTEKRQGGVAYAAPLRLLAVDPGDTTGWALFEFSEGCWELKLHGQVQEGKLPDVAKERIDVLVIEGIPIRGHGVAGSIQVQVLNECVKMAQDKAAVFYQVNPSTWKPWAKGRVREEAAAIISRSVHARDAYCMGRYVLWRYLGAR